MQRARDQASQPCRWASKLGAPKLVIKKVYNLCPQLPLLPLMLPLLCLTLLLPLPLLHMPLGRRRRWQGGEELLKQGACKCLGHYLASPHFAAQPR